MAGLYLLGRRLKGNALGIVLVYLWAAYPFTLYALNSNTNDSLVAATLVFALLAITSAPGRGVMALLAGMTKFAPFALAPNSASASSKRRIAPLCSAPSKIFLKFFSVSPMYLLTTPAIRSRPVRLVESSSPRWKTT